MGSNRRRLSGAEKSCTLSFIPPPSPLLSQGGAYHLKDPLPDLDFPSHWYGPQNTGNVLFRALSQACWAFKVLCDF